MEDKTFMDLKDARHTFRFSGWTLLLALMIPVLINVVLGALGDTLGRSFPALFENRLFLWILSFVPMYGIGIPVGMLLLNRLPKDTAEQKKMSARNFLVAFIMCVPMLIVGNILGTLMAGILSGGRSVNNVAQMIAQQDPLRMLTMTIAAPLLEELVFRKFLIDRTVRFGEKNAILFSALAFGLFHCNVYQIFYAFGIGLIFGYIYVRTRNVRYTMLMHFLINFFSGVVAAFFMGKVDENLMGMVVNRDIESLMALAVENPEMLISFYASMAPVMLQSLINMGLTVAGIVLLGLKKKEFFFLPQPQQVSGRAGRKAMLLNAGVLCFFLAALVQTVRVLISTCR